jgi:hypothetical protein
MLQLSPFFLKPSRCFHMKKLAPWFIGLCLLGSSESTKTYRRAEIEMTVFWITDCGSWDKRRSTLQILGERSSSRFR